MLTELVRPKSSLLTSLARVKAELKMDTSANDATLRTYITEASDTIMRELGYKVPRAQVRETVVGEGRSELLLSRTPVAKIDSVTIDGVLVDPELYSVEPEPGILLHKHGWENTHHFGAWIDRYERTDLGRFDISIDYWGGALMPADDVLASGISVVSDEEGGSFVFPNPPLLVEGDVIEAAGFDDEENNGQFTVVSRDADKIVVASDLADEAIAPAGATITVRTLPPGLERLAVDTVKAWWLGRTRDPNVTSERIGDWSATWKDGAEYGVLPASVCKSLERYQRIA